jgi:hypothetical protein
MFGAVFLLCAMEWHHKENLIGSDAVQRDFYILVIKRESSRTGRTGICGAKR